MPENKVALKTGTLYLIPSGLGDAGSFRMADNYFSEVVKSLHFYIVEEVRTARRFISGLQLGITIDRLTFQVLNEHSRPNELEQLLTPLLAGNNVGLLSEAGYPAVADPGSAVVALAHQKGLKVVPLPGYSSLLLALAASGLNGQHFAFNGYLPVKSPDREKKIRQIERRSREEGQSQLFIEAPYRNQKLLDALISTCMPSTLLCLAVDITLPTESIRTASMADWKLRLPDINKKPVVFVLQA